MNKLAKYLGVVSLVFSFVGPASAASLQEYLFTFSYNTNGSFTLSNLSYSYSGGSNTLSGIYTTSGGGVIGAGSGSISQLVSVDTSKSYASNYSVSHFTGTTSSFGLSVSAVPLPAGLPLFALAIFALGLVGYRTARKRAISLQAV
ncbi:hypothetical protein [Bradyrhizobium sp. LTSP857]|uniref:hypothetical protein n=1 Tax=Bradyrhizobium sp. LTSP857 TaxID=1619231 RepID=UPI0012DFEA1D|nr:hypothetical protein [Bradyrhizobium sp. LTSP857]